MSAFLLDTHALLWATSRPDLLSEAARRTLGDNTHRIFVSLGTLWEFSIKVSIGKLILPERFFGEIGSLGYEMLPMTEKHFTCYRSLPLIHRDPFDRLLVAQAMTEDLPLISNDPEIRKYGVPVHW